LKPKGLAKRLDQFVKEGDRWMRLCAEVWFSQSDPLIEEGTSSQYPAGLLERYEEAIVTARWIAEFAKLAEEKLNAGKSESARKRDEVKAGQASNSEELVRQPEIESAPAPGDEEAQQLGIELAEHENDEDYREYFT
jgi:hypothetical protein